MKAKILTRNVRGTYPDVPIEKIERRKYLIFQGKREWEISILLLLANCKHKGLRNDLEMITEDDEEITFSILAMDEIKRIYTLKHMSNK